MADIPEYMKPQLDELDKKLAEAQSLLADPDMKAMAEEEIQQIELQKAAIIEAISPREETTDTLIASKGAHLEIRGAAGGEEAKIWAGDLFRMYLRFLDNSGWKYELTGESSLKVKHKEAYPTLQYESGVHRVQRIPETEKNGRIHTSTATVAVLPVIPPAQIEVRPEEIRMDYFRSGGAGGQNVNKVNTGVRLTHTPTGLVVECTQKRTQYENREVAEEMLRGRLWQMEEEKRLAEIDSKRAEAVGRGMRAEKIRTYNYPQNRVTDHRMNQSWYDLDNIMEGRLDKVFQALHSWEQDGSESSEDTSED